ncbi:MAG: hypothetical protein SVY53_12595 [Chloroflexota bacterium]|nr:hypothetical protein [Chloroflexota bacterium]
MWRPLVIIGISCAQLELKSGRERMSRNASEPDSASSDQYRVTSLLLVMKERANAAIGAPAVVGDSARRKINRGTERTCLVLTGMTDMRTGCLSLF